LLLFRRVVLTVVLVVSLVTVLRARRTAEICVRLRAGLRCALRLVCLGRMDDRELVVDELRAVALIDGDHHAGTDETESAVERLECLDLHCRSPSNVVLS